MFRNSLYRFSRPNPKIGDTIPTNAITEIVSSAQQRRFIPTILVQAVTQGDAPNYFYLKTYPESIAIEFENFFIKGNCCIKDADTAFNLFRLAYKYKIQKLQDFSLSSLSFFLRLNYDPQQFYFFCENLEVYDDIGFVDCLLRFARKLTENQMQEFDRLVKQRTINQSMSHQMHLVLRILESVRKYPGIIFTVNHKNQGKIFLHDFNSAMILTLSDIIKIFKANHIHLVDSYDNPRVQKEELENLKSVLALNTCIKSLEIRGKFISDEGVKHLAQMVKNNQIKLDLTNTLFVDTNICLDKRGHDEKKYHEKRKVEDLASYEKCMTTILEAAMYKEAKAKGLILKNLRFGLNGSKMLSKVLQSSASAANLKSLSFSITDLAPAEMDSLTKAISQNSKLKVLHIDYNHDADLLADVSGGTHNKNYPALIAKCEDVIKREKVIKNRKKLIERQEQLIKQSKEQAEFLKNQKSISRSLLKALTTNKSIETVSICSLKYLDEAGAFELQALMENNKTIKELKLGQPFPAEIRELAWNIFFTGLASNSGLQSLDLSNNYLSDKHIEMLAKGLETNTFMLHLNLSGNNIGLAGAKALAQALKKNTTLKILDLKGSNVGKQRKIDGQDFSKELIAMLFDNKTLQALDLSENHIDSSANKEMLANECMNYKR